MDNTNLTSLARFAAKGDASALTELYEATCRPMYFYCVKTLGNEHDSLDAMQNAYVQLITRIETLKKPDMFLCWFKRIVFNECNNILRKKKKYVLNDDEGREFSKQEDDEFLPEDVLISKEKGQVILGALDKLPAAQKQTLLLYYYDQMSSAQIAYVTDVPEGTVRYRLHEGRKKLKKELEELDKKGMIAIALLVPVLTSLLRRVAEDQVIPIATAVLGDAAAAAGTSITSATAVSGAVHGSLWSLLTAKYAAIPLLVKLLSGGLLLLVIGGLVFLTDDTGSVPVMEMVPEVHIVSAAGAETSLKSNESSALTVSSKPKSSKAESTEPSYSNPPRSKPESSKPVNAKPKVSRPVSRQPEPASIMPPEPETSFVPVTDEYYSVTSEAPKVPEKSEPPLIAESKAPVVTIYRLTYTGSGGRNYIQFSQVRADGTLTDENMARVPIDKELLQQSGMDKLSFGRTYIVAIVSAPPWNGAADYYVRICIDSEGNVTTAGVTLTDSGLEPAALMYNVSILPGGILQVSRH